MPGGWELRWQLEAESMRRDETIAALTARDMRRMPDVVEYANHRGLAATDLLAYSANAEGRLRLVAIFPGDPRTTDPAVLCLDGPRRSKHRNPPFDNGVFGCSAHLCLYFSEDPDERRWLPEHGLVGLFDLARVHLAKEHEWRRSGRWPGEDAPHGETTPVRPNPALAVAPISSRNPILDYDRAGSAGNSREPELVA